LFLSLDRFELKTRQDGGLPSNPLKVLSIFSVSDVYPAIGGVSFFEKGAVSFGAGAAKLFGIKPRYTGIH
jgi:hypothetical protein